MSLRDRGTDHELEGRKAIDMVLAAELARLDRGRALDLHEHDAPNSLRRSVLEGRLHVLAA